MSLLSLSRRLITTSFVLAASVACLVSPRLVVVAGEGSVFMSAGIATYLNPTEYPSIPYDAPAAPEPLSITEKIEIEQQRIVEELAMANIQTALNVRAEASETSARVGVLYKDCGGTILERADGWIKIKSGDVVGWAKEEFLVTGEEAQAMADDVGNWIATIDTDVVRVREEPSMEQEVNIIGYISYDDGVNIVEVVDEDWVCVDYEGAIGYVAADCIDVRYHIDEGETIAVIRAREEAERERNRTRNRGRVDATADELRLLGALIYCEAGNQSYAGKVGVGAVVMNRLRHSAYPNTIYGVIYASGQFTPAMTGKVARIYESGVPESCMRAAQAAINGETTVGGSLYFRRNNGTRQGIVIGAHVFY
jgi:SH3-like domain-containing protein